MITAEDIERFRQMEETTPKKLVVVETQQYFEIEIPADMDADEFVQSAECRTICAEKISSGLTDLMVDRVLTKQDVQGLWTDG